MPVHATTFDFWYTLFCEVTNRSPLRQEIRARAISEATGVAVGDAVDAFTEVAKEFGRVHIEEKRTLAPLDAVHMTVSMLGVTVDDAEADRLAEVVAGAIVEHPPEPIDGALDAVRAAAACGPVGIVSDTGYSPGASLRVLLDRHGFTPYIQTCAFSDEVGVSKPQRRMFETAANGMGVAVDELLHIGDLEPTDVAGALDVGATAALFTGANDKYADDTQAHHVFGAWPEFVEAAPRLIEG